MGNLFNALNNLKTNIFGGPGNTGHTKPPASRVGKDGKGITLSESPTGRLADNPLAFSSFSYPSDVTNDAQNGHYLLFYVNVQNRTKYAYKNYKNESIGNVKQVVINQYDEDIAAARASGSFVVPGADKDITVDRKNVDTKGMPLGEKVYYQNRSKKDFGAASTYKDAELFSNTSDARNRAALTGIGAKAKTTSRITDSIAIYLPPNVVDTTSATYNDMATGMMGYAAAGALDFSTFVGDGDYEAAAKTLTGGFATFTTEALKKSAAALAETLSGSEGAVQLGNRVFGQADNPYLEVLFETMNVRSFTYNFTFAPRNEDERNECQRIIQLFRFHMAPELQGGQSRFLTLPSEFDIHYMYQAKDGVATENDYYNRIGTCVLENCEVNYAPEGVKSFGDGSPTKINMALTFKETEVLTKEKISQGF
jgi:hypothetical protein